MKLKQSITLRPYSYKDQNNNIVTPSAIVLEELDVTYIYRPKTYSIYAQIVNIPGFILLLQASSLEELNNITIQHIDNLFKDILNEDPQAILQSQFPRSLESDPDGPGTILSNMLSYIGINSSPNCSCKQRAIEMNIKGPDWCENNISTILGWLKEESNKRNLPFIETIAKMVVLRAIRVSKKLQKNNS
jgi:hypothetical protein